MVRADVKLDRLHRVLQSAMGWTNSHLHLFQVGKTIYGQPDPELDALGHETLDERRYALAEIAPRAKQKFIYEYDFGDGWEHEIVVEAILPSDPGFKHPLCLAGANACPPEDCGGPPGYEEFLAAIRDPRHPEHKDQLAWAGGKFDPEAFDVAAVNRRLRLLK